MSSYRVPSVVAAIRVLHELDVSGDGGLAQIELVRATGVSKSTMHNLLATLEAEGFVRRDPRSRGYRLGPALITLGAAASRQTKLVQTAIDLLAPLAGARGLSFALAQRTGDGQAQVIERFYPPSDVHVGITIGSRFGAFDGAIGKVLMAAMEPGELERLLRGRPLPAHTDSTITDPAALVEEVRQTRERGWAISEQELNENNAVAAPVWGLSGEVELILLALGFAAELGGDRMEETAVLLAGTAEEIMRVSGTLPARGAAEAGVARDAGEAGAARDAGEAGAARDAAEAGAA
ncbi:MAG: IclR family transcriptional regulator [Solirubrobacterales bacterium]